MSRIVRILYRFIEPEPKRCNACKRLHGGVKAFCCLPKGHTCPHETSGGEMFV